MEDKKNPKMKKKKKKKRLQVTIEEIKKIQKMKTKI